MMVVAVIVRIIVVGVITTTITHNGGFRFLECLECMGTVLSLLYASSYCNNPLRKMFLPYFTVQKTRGSKRLRHLRKITWLVSGRRSSNQVSLLNTAHDPDSCQNTVQSKQVLLYGTCGRNINPIQEGTSLVIICKQVFHKIAYLLRESK